MLNSGQVPSDKRQAPSPSPGELVQRARNRAGLTQEDLAERIGKHVTTIRNLEGDRHFSRGTVEAVARVLATTPEALGFRFRKPLRASELTPAQRDLVDELLSLPENEQAKVRQVLSALLAERRRGSRK
jgi:transcriptional regulator with XRE-family HTH domain